MNASRRIGARFWRWLWWKHCIVYGVRGPSDHVIAFTRTEYDAPRWALVLDWIGDHHDQWASWWAVPIARRMPKRIYNREWWGDDPFCALYCGRLSGFLWRRQRNETWTEVPRWEVPARTLEWADKLNKEE